MAHKKDSTPSKKKDKYRIRNWAEYNRSLVNRGSITFWFDEEAIKKWHGRAALNIVKSDQVLKKREWPKSDGKQNGMRTGVS